jgi:hypothetical protein
VSEHIHKPRLAEILAQAKQSCPDCVTAALVEGLPPLARIAFTARMARRAQRFFRFRVEPARLVIDSSIRGAEKAASGEALSADEDLAAWDQAVCQACQLEKQAGDQAAAKAGQVGRRTARCVYGPEFAYGENAIHAHWDVLRTVADTSRARGLEGSRLEGAVADEDRAVLADLQKLVLFALAAGERWIDPKLNSPLMEIGDSDWKLMLEETGIGIGRWPAGQNAERWQRIHKALRQQRRVLYPADLFGPA